MNRVPRHAKDTVKLAHAVAMLNRHSQKYTGFSGLAISGKVKVMSAASHFALPRFVSQLTAASSFLLRSNSRG